MRSFSTLSVLACVGASTASVVRRAPACCFSLSASGSSVEQLGDGQLRINQSGLSNAGQFCLSSSGGVTDSQGRGCIITAPTSQLQCDSGASPTLGFTVNGSGQLTYNGSPTFYACPTGDNGGYNIYSQTLQGQTCKVVYLSTEGGNCVSTTTPAASTAAASTSAASTKAATTSAASTSAASTPAASTKAATTSAATTPAASTKASTTPAATTPAATTPAATTPVATTPVSAPTSATPEVHTVYSTVTQVVTASCPACPACPASSNTPQVQTTQPATSAQSQPASQPASSGTPQAYTSQPATSAQSQPATSAQSQAASYPASSGTPQVHTSQAATSAQSQQASSTASPTNSEGACPTNLSGAYQYPHLINPVNSSSPDTSYGTSYFATFSQTISTVFTFDVPASYANDKCSLVFLFPTQDQLETSSFTISGSGGLKFSQLDTAVDQQCSYSGLSARTELDSISQVQAGNSWVVNTKQCMANQRVSILVEATDSLSLRFFEDYNPSPIGLYMTQC